MSRKYNVSKRKNKGLIGSVVLILSTMLLVGCVGTLSKGFRDWNVKGWFVTSEKVEKDNRVGLYKVNLKTDVKGSVLTTSTLISYLNEGLGSSDPIFKDVDYVEKEVQVPDETNPDTTKTEIQKEYLLTAVYKDNGGMKFGSSSLRGSFSVNLVDGATFNRAKIIGRNYSSKNGSTGEYSCDESSIILNGSEAQIFGTNIEDKTKEAPIEEKTFTFTDMQNQLSISVLGKRATLFTIELWTEVVNNSTTSLVI